MLESKHPIFRRGAKLLLRKMKLNVITTVAEWGTPLFIHS